MTAHRFKGRTTGMRVQHYQDYTLMINDEDNRRFTDAKLVEAWHDEHPDALHLDKLDKNGVFTYVRSIRRDFNKGTKEHGVRDRDGTIVGPPKVPSLPYNDKGQTYAYERKWNSSYY